MACKKKKSVRLAPVVYGTTWDGVDFTFTVPVGSADLSAVTMSFGSTEEDATPDLVLTSAGGDITITDATTPSWVFTVDPITPFNTLAAGVWFWDLWTTDAAGNVKVYVGGSIEVEPSIPVS